MIRNGFTLIETLIALVIFAIIAGGVYLSYSNVLDIFSASYLNLTALGAMNNEFEIIRNMPYKDIGIQGGSPPGKLLPEKNITFGNIQFVVKTTIRNIDDLFDGTQGGNPDDGAPADYKLVGIELSCPSCPRFIPAKATTAIAPPGLESVTSNGTLLIKVFNASGQPISGADVSIVNNLVSPIININDTTDSAGILKLVDIATSSAGYEITVTKSGYSTDRTYPPGALSNPNPLKPYASVFEQQITQVSFVVDRVSTLNVKTQDAFCAGIGSINFLQTGQKLIGTNPDVLKYSAANATNVSGTKAILNLEFDTYYFRNQDDAYEIGGFGPLTPIAIDPNSTYGLVWLMEPNNSSGAVVTVMDQDGQLINDAKIVLANQEKYTGRKFFVKTDWSGGQYDSKSESIEADNPVGDIGIVQIGGKYASMSDEWLISQTIDMGVSDANFYDLIFNSIQPLQTSVKIQLASNNDNSTWNFVGPDGTASSYYTLSDVQINPVHNGNRYVRYKIILRTDDDSVAPTIQDLSFYFHSSCIPDGQAYFDGLNQGTYAITVEKQGYQAYTDTAVIIDEDWEDYRLTLIP